MASKGSCSLSLASLSKACQHYLPPSLLCCCHIEEWQLPHTNSLIKLSFALKFSPLHFLLNISEHVSLTLNLLKTKRQYP